MIEPILLTDLHGQTARASQSRDAASLWSIIETMSKWRNVYADARDPGLSFILPSLDPDEGGLVRNSKDGHFGTIVGRGGAGKSILALQIVTELLENADRVDTAKDPDRPHAAFYFSLEASPKELRTQVEQFHWGWRRYASFWDPKHDFSRVSGDDEYSKGLYIISIPSPADSLNALSLRIRQTIASQLKRFRSLQAIVIDPMGAVDAGDDLRTNLIQLKQLAETHGTFVFLLTEKYAFEKYNSIEHYSQSIIHLEHDPGQQQHRRLYVQKARGQSFRSGYHYFELQPPQGSADTTESKNSSSEGRKIPDGLSRGIRVFPSIAAQSAYAHERLSLKKTTHAGHGVPFFPNEGEKRFLTDGELIEPGSAVFLMGPPGTFKEYVASQFAKAAADKNGASIYISFKADLEAIVAAMGKDTKTGDPDSKDIGLMPERPATLYPKTYFFDARSPLLTPEEILFKVRTFITPPPPVLKNMKSINEKQAKPEVAFQRAIIWGLRRLYDFPNFKDGRVIQFLEALVTMLKSQQITTLLVDWPDQQTANTVPIVDLCQYIFLTRVCYSKESPEASDPKKNLVRHGLVEQLWSSHPKQVALLRAQRTRRGVHHDEGAILRKDSKGNTGRISVSDLPIGKTFEHLWLNAGIEWEKDLSLLS